MTNLEVMMIRTCIIYFFGFLPIVAGAQQVETIYQSFRLDSIQTIQFSFTDSVEVVPWEGASLLSETRIELYNANANILKHFLDSGRYAMEVQKSGAVIALSPKFKKRPPIKIKGIECQEIISNKIYIPLNYSTTTSNVWSRN